MAPRDTSLVGGWRSPDGVRDRGPGPGLRSARRAAVPLRIAPLLVVGLIFLVLAVLGVATL